MNLLLGRFRLITLIWEKYRQTYFWFWNSISISLVGWVTRSSATRVECFMLISWHGNAFRIAGLFSIGSDNGLAPTRQQAFIWNNDGYFWEGNPATDPTHKGPVMRSFGVFFVRKSFGRSWWARSCQWFEASWFLYDFIVYIYIYIHI